MAFFFHNAVFDTKRSSFSLVTGVTGTPLTYLAGQSANIRQLIQSDYILLPEAALKSVFVLSVDPNVDVNLMDVITNIRYSDGVTPMFPLGPNEMWRVLFVYHNPPPFLEHKRCYVGRFTGGGIPS